MANCKHSVHDQKQVASIYYARAIVITLMVFGHIPTSLSDWHSQYIGCFQMAFFLSYAAILYTLNII